MENNEDNRQMTEEKIWKVYLLPHANYCGVSSNLHKRLIQHRSRHKRNTDDFIILAEFNDKRLALDFETSYQLEHNCNGYPFPPERREKISENTRRFGEERIYKKTRVPVRCIETGEVYDSVRACELALNGSINGSLSKHLKRRPKYMDFKGFHFEYVNEKIGNPENVYVSWANFSNGKRITRTKMLHAFISDGASFTSLCSQAKSESEVILIHCNDHRCERCERIIKSNQKFKTHEHGK